MILTRLVDSGGGGSSRLGGLVQRGLRLFRRALQREAKPVGAENPLVRLCPQPVPLVREHALAVFKRETSEILSGFLKRRQIEGVVGEMRRRYALRVMSGPAGFNPGLGNRLVIYGFVGLSFGNAVANRNGSLEMGDDHTAQEIKELFGSKPQTQFISKEFEEDAFAVVEQRSISEDSDVTILSDDDSDFEILDCGSNGVFVSDAEDDCNAEPVDLAVRDEVKRLEELVELDNQQQDEIYFLMQKLCLENDNLKHIINVQIEKENLLKTELANVLNATNEQQKELFLLRELVVNQNSALQKLYNQPKSIQSASYPFRATFRNSRPKGLVFVQMCGEPGALEFDEEALRAAGGRVRALKIHRKQRLKKN